MKAKTRLIRNQIPYINYIGLVFFGRFCRMLSAMNQNSFSIETQKITTDNPKAVFYGSNSQIITSIGKYLAERSVDLYAGKTFEDAFFGQYFFYIGNSTDVKGFIAEFHQTLPKTLLILTDHVLPQDFTELLTQYSQIKVAIIGELLEFSRELTEEMITFFLGSSDQILELPESLRGRPGSKSLLTHVLEPVTSSQKAIPPQSLIREPETAPTGKDLSGTFALTNFSSKKAERQVSVDIPDDTIGPSVSTMNETFNDQKIDQILQPKPTGIFGFVPMIKSRGLFIFAIGILGSLIVLPFMLTIVTGSAGVYHLYKAREDSRSFHIAASTIHARKAEKYFPFAQNTLSFLVPLLELVQIENPARGTQKLLEIGTKSAKGMRHLLFVVSDVSTLMKGISGQTKGIAFAQLLSSIKGNLSLADTELALAEAAFKHVSLQETWMRVESFSIGQNLQKLFRELSNIRGRIATLRQGLVLVPEFIGLYGKRTYLVIFQNNMELRPTGGFIGSFGLLTMEDGMLNDFVVQDIYTADGVLKGHIDPPEPIKTHLGQEHWYMRDSNWDPDFFFTGARLVWFMEKELDMQVDGVVAIDLTFIQELLKITGPVEIKDFNETVTSDNLFLNLEKRIQSEQFPGSTQKKDILSSLASVLMKKLLSLDVPITEFPAVVHRALEEKHLQVYLVGTESERLINEFGWGGKMSYADACLSPGCIADYLKIVDANLGVNKVNYYLDRTLGEDVRILETGSVEHILTVTYKNRSSEDDPFAGVYKNYLRVYVPKESVLTGAEVNSLPLTISSDAVASSSSVVSTNEREFTVLSHLLEVFPEEEKSLVLRYVSATPVSGPQIRYAMRLDKQAGTGKDPVRVSIRYPKGWQAMGRSGTESDIAGISTAVESINEITYNTNLSKDQLITLDLLH